MSHVVEALSSRDTPEVWRTCGITWSMVWVGWTGPFCSIGMRTRFKPKLSMEPRKDRSIWPRPGVNGNISRRMWYPWQSISTLNSCCMWWVIHDYCTQCTERVLQKEWNVRTLVNNAHGLKLMPLRSPFLSNIIPAYKILPKNLTSWHIIIHAILSRPRIRPSILPDRDISILLWLNCPFNAWELIFFWAMGVCHLGFGVN